MGQVSQLCNGSNINKDEVNTMTPRDAMGRVKSYARGVEKGSDVKMPNLRMFDSPAKSEMRAFDTHDAQFLP